MPNTSTHEIRCKEWSTHRQHRPNHARPPFVPINATTDGNVALARMAQHRYDSVHQGRYACKRRGGVTAEVKVEKVKKQLMVPVAKAAANCQKNHCSEQSLLCFFFFSLYLWWTIVVVAAAAVVVCAVFVVLFDLKVDPIFFHKCRAWFDSPMLALV